MGEPMVKRIATSTVLVLVLASAAIAFGEASPRGTETVGSAFRKPQPKKPKPVHPVHSVPEPGSLLLFGGALVAGAGALKRKA
jgi:hypothetical protein